MGRTTEYMDKLIRESLVEASKKCNMSSETKLNLLNTIITGFTEEKQKTSKESGKNGS